MRAGLHYIDTFTRRPLGGNPASVCVLPAWPSDDTLLAVAGELNLSVTAFIVAAGASPELRLFTPVGEIGPAGHATMAAAHVALHLVAPGAAAVTFTLRGFEPVTAAREGERIALDYPAMPGARVPAPPALVEGLGVTPREVLIAPFGYVAVVDDEQTIRDLAPRMEPLLGLDRGSAIVTAPGRDCDFVSRVFSPKLGLPEDPVCGTAHRIMVPYWAGRLGRADLRAIQISRRRGDFWCRDMPGRTILAGHCAPLFSASFGLPDTAGGVQT